MIHKLVHADYEIREEDKIDPMKFFGTDKLINYNTIPYNIRDMDSYANGPANIRTNHIESRIRVDVNAIKHYGLEVRKEKRREQSIMNLIMIAIYQINQQHLKMLRKERDSRQDSQKKSMFYQMKSETLKE